MILVYILNYINGVQMHPFVIRNLILFFVMSVDSLLVDDSFSVLKK